LKGKNRLTFAAACEIIFFEYWKWENEMARISGAQIKAARALAGLTQAQLAELAGLTDVTVTQIESGQRDPHVSTLYKILEALQGRDVVFTARGVELRTRAERSIHLEPLPLAAAV
jgi:transcriptional regulator with XRE-family HTH domain